MTLTYILPTVPNCNEWKLCQFLHCKLHAHNYTCIPKNLGRRGTPDPTGQLVELGAQDIKGCVKPLVPYSWDIKQW